jgi:predicted metal-dependent phosphoesterase TrpH
MLMDLHCHTYYSHRSKIKYDGTTSPESMVKAAAGQADAIAICDHNSTLGWKEAKKAAKKYNIMFIPGEEIDTSDGHVLALNITETIRPWMTVEETVDEIHSQGGIAVASHPFDIKRDGTREKSIHCDALEGFNAINFDRFMNRRCVRFAQKHNKPLTAGSDAHAPFMVGRGLTSVKALNVDNAMKEIKRGNTKIIGSYQPITTVMRWSLDKIKMSEPHIMDYIEDNYGMTKKFLCKKLLSLANKSPGKIDVFFKGIAYFSLGSVITYTAVRSALGKT